MIWAPQIAGMQDADLHFIHLIITRNYIQWSPCCKTTPSAVEMISCGRCGLMFALNKHRYQEPLV